MLYYALMFLVGGLIAGALNLAEMPTVSVQISWFLFLILTGIVLVALHVITDGTVRVVRSENAGVLDSFPA